MARRVRQRKVAAPNFEMALQLCPGYEPDWDAVRVPNYCSYAPGSADKVAVLRRRFETGEVLFVTDDVGDHLEKRIFTDS